MRTADFDYQLPAELIAQSPMERRDESRLLVVHRGDRRIEHRQFGELLDYLQPGDMLVLNDSRVIPARLRGIKPSGGRVEMLLVEEVGRNDWWAMVRPGKRVRIGARIDLVDPQGQPAPCHAMVREKNSEGHCRLEFHGEGDLVDALGQLGEVPLPPYIDRPPQREDLHRYQTVFARPTGSVAAPTAGLHFTPELLASLRARGVDVCFVTLHVGLGTFAPVKAERLEEHVMHEERFELTEGVARRINEARRRGNRVVAVGTTSVRVLESVAAQTGGELAPTRSRTKIFIYPPFQFRVVDALLTNFHLPQSTLLMLVSAFAAPGETRGREQILAAYAEAVRERYRFFSYGDAMLLV